MLLLGSPVLCAVPLAGYYGVDLSTSIFMRWPGDCRFCRFFDFVFPVWYGSGRWEVIRWLSMIVVTNHAVTNR